MSALKVSKDPAQVKLGNVLEESLRSYEVVHDYRAIFHKQEGAEGKLDPEEIIFLKFEKPFKIFMGWLNTHKKGLQVVYERGKHDGKLAIHKPGLLFGLAQVVFLDQSSPWVREGSASYDIEDAGIGTFLYDFAEAVALAARDNKLNVKWPGPDEAEVTFVGSKADEGYFAYRVKVLFDAQNHLPVRMELFDWQNRPMGIYRYEDLNLNVGQTDEIFKKEINRRLYRVYEGKS